MLPKTLQHENLIYQFRPISRISYLNNGKIHKDIERLNKREIYFSPLGQLNDPLDGKIRFIWNAEKEIWKGFIYHYANVLYTRIILITLEADMNEIKNFHTHGYINNDLPFKQSLRIALDNFFDTKSGEEILIQLSSKNKLYTDDIVSFFGYFIHHEVLQIISSTFSLPFTQQGLEFLKQKPINEYEYMKNSFLSEKENVSKELQLMMYTELSFLREMLNKQNDSIPKEIPNYLFQSFHYIKYLFCADFIEKFQSHALYQWGISSFSNKCSNTLMWSHYAESHKGICLVFEVNSKDCFDPYKFFNSDDLKDYFFNSSICSNGILLGKVNNVDDVPEQSIFKTMDQFARGTADEIFSFYDGGIDAFYPREERIKQIDELYKKASLQKTLYWEYEDEVRMIMTGLHERYTESVKNNKTVLRFNLENLKGVIFGVRTSIDDKLKVIDVLKEMYKKQEAKPVIYQAIYSQNDNEIKVSPQIYANLLLQKSAKIDGN